MSSTIPILELQVCADDLRAYAWETVLEKAESQTRNDYFQVLAMKAKSLAEAGDLRGERVLNFLAIIANFFPSFDSDHEPYRPRMASELGRSPIPDDLRPDHLDTLAQVLPDIRNAEFRARVGDVLWHSRNEYKAAQIAVLAFIESSRGLEGERFWLHFAERLLRALQIGARLGKESEYHKRAIEAVKSAIVRHEKADQGLLTNRLMRHILGKVENPAEYSTIAEKLARRAMDAKQWHFAREYWQIKGDWDALGGNQDGCRSTLIEIAGVYMLEIESITSNAKPSFVTASGLMAKRVEALRRAKAEQAEIAKARRLLLEYQQQAEAELSQGPRFEFPENERDRLRTIAEKASERVRGLSFETAILRLALITRPTDPDQIRKRIEKATAQGFISQAFGSTVLRPGGQVADTRPAITMGSVESREDGVRKDMWSQARDVDWPYRTAARIEPARRTIVAEHPARISDLAFIVQHNPFVPHGREILFLRGLHAGLHGDFPLAIHFLPPQIEHSIRTILAAHGVITSKLEPDQRQDERDLGWLLTQPEMERVFSKPITFDLRGLLVERFGENIRNQVAHGMFEVEQMFSPTVCYVWWLALSLCCVPLIRSNKEQATHPTQEPQT